MLGTAGPAPIVAFSSVDDDTELVGSDRLVDDALRGIGWRMVIDNRTIEIISSLDRHGIPAVLLKGPAIARWLYDRPEERTYVDIDLLVAPDDVERSGSLLADKGFDLIADVEPQVPRPEGEAHHAQTWYRAADGIAVDLHRCLHHTEHLPPTQVWEEVWSDHDHLDLYGTEVAIPAERVRALHVILHLQPKDRPGSRAWIDLERAIDRVDMPVWSEASALAERFGLQGEMGSLLRLAPGGEALADRLGLPAAVPRRLLQQHRRHAPSIPKLLLRLEGSDRRSAARVLRAKVVPPPERMRRVSAMARRGRAGLMAAYVVHVARAPRLVWEWLGYRRRGPGLR